jgi:hypothetical protein
MKWQCQAVSVMVLSTLAFQVLHPQDAPTPSPVSENLVSIIVERPLEEINAQIERTDAAIESAEARSKKTSDLIETADTRIDMNEKEVDLIEAQITAAEKGKRDTEVLTLQTRKRIAEQFGEILEQERNLRKAEAEAAASDAEYGKALLKSLRLEGELAEKRIESKQAAGTAGEMVRALVRELEGKTLEAQIDASKLRQRAVDRETRVLESRQELLESQNKLGGRG